MLDIFNGIISWSQQGKPFALATVIRTWGSAPRLAGSSMAISADQEMIGSVSGGCVEGDVVRAASVVLKTGKPQVLEYGVTNEDAWAVGLSCGGRISVFVEPFLTQTSNPKGQAIWKELQTAVSQNSGCLLMSRMSGDSGGHILIHPTATFTTDLSTGVDKELITLGIKAYKERKNQSIEFKEEPWFAQVFPRKSQLIIIGAAHITNDLISLAHNFDFETIVIDPRGIFTSKTQFSVPPDQLFEEWPAEVLPTYTLDDYTYAVLLTHDPKIDDQALHILLRSNVAYIGALGSRKTHTKRIARLTREGFTTAEIDRIHGPIGIDIKAKRPKEIALSIMGQIIQTQNAFL